MAFHVHNMVGCRPETQPLRHTRVVTDKTAWRWWKPGHLDAYPTPTGTGTVRDLARSASTTGRVAWYARVSSAEQRRTAEADQLGPMRACDHLHGV